MNHAIITAALVAERTDKEVRSAELLCNSAPRLLTEPSLDAAARLILATGDHHLPPDLGTKELTDAAHSLDIDLAIPSARGECFDELERQVRRESARA